MVEELVVVNGVVPPNTTPVTIASGFSGLNGVAVGASGDVFIADQGSGAVKEIVAVNGVVSSSSTVNKIGKFFYPDGVAGDASQNIFASEGNLGEVAELNESASSGLNLLTQAAGTTSAASSVVVQNSGNAPSTISSLALSGAAFALDSGSTTCSATTPVAADTPCTIGVTFAPPTLGPFTGSVPLSSNNLNAAGSQTAIPLAGTGAIAGFSITRVPASVVAGTPVQATVTAVDVNGNTVLDLQGGLPPLAPPRSGEPIPPP